MHHRLCIDWFGGLEINCVMTVLVDHRLIVMTGSLTGSVDHRLCIDWFGG